MKINETARGLYCEFTLQLPGGMHARPSAKFAQLAQSFSSDIVLINENGEVNAKSMLDVLSLGIKKGDNLILMANGSDARLALEKLSEFCQDGRDHYGKICA